MINSKQFCFTFTLLFCVLYYITLIVVQVNDKSILVHPFSSACQIFSQTDQPSFAIAARTDASPFSFRTYKLTNKNCEDITVYGKWFVKYRPVVGDHIHVGISIREEGEDLTLRDRKLVEPIPYEEYKPSDTCVHPPKYAYTKQWFHSGVHTHCDNIIHVHPWSAPRELRVEGKSVVLGTWFESVGISVDPEESMLRMPNSTYKQWTMEYYINVQDYYPSFTTTSVEAMVNLWLVDHHGYIKLYDSTSVAPPKDLKVLQYESVSRIGSKYPKRRI
jgi:hypothetical protein